MSATKEITIAVVKFLEKAFEAWQVFISTRQEAYERKKDKEIRKALNVAEDAFEVTGKLFEFVYTKTYMDKITEREYGNIKSKFYKLKKKFNDLD